MVMIELIGCVAGPLTGASVLAVVYFLAKAFDLKRAVVIWVEHMEMRATARRMRSEGASAKQVARFLADHAIARAGRSP
jgi:predicted outer membrane lipoprotein